MYLEVVDSASLPNGWGSYAQFSMTVVDQITNKYSVRKVAYSVCSLQLLQNELPCMYVKEQ